MKKKMKNTGNFEVMVDGQSYTRRPNGLWVYTDRIWEKVVGPMEGQLESLYAGGKEKGQAGPAKAQPMIERVRIPRMESDDEWFERVYG